METVVNKEQRVDSPTGARRWARDWRDDFGRTGVQDAPGTVTGGASRFTVTSRGAAAHGSEPI